MSLIVKSRFRRAAVATLLSALLAGPAVVRGWPGTPHKLCVHNNLLTFDVARHGDLAAPNTREGPRIVRDMPFSFFPELLGTSTSMYRGNEPGSEDGPMVDAQNWSIVWWNSNSPDQWEGIDWSYFGCPAATPATKTIRHFWDPDIGGAIGMTAGPMREANQPTATGVPELCPDPLDLRNADLYPNAWVKGRVHWNIAIAFWLFETSDPLLRKAADGWAWTHLGHALHMLTDMGQPAHLHEDMHNDSDALERWMGEEGQEARITSLYSWFPPGYAAAGTTGATDWSNTDGASPPGRIPGPGELFYPPANGDVCTHLAGISFTGSTYRYDDPIYMLNDPTLIDDCNAAGTYKLGELFYLYYVLSQVGDYYPSDQGDGDMQEPTGWLGGYAGFPTETPEHIDIHSREFLTDHEDPLRDDDGDLMLILTGLSPAGRAMYRLESGHYGAFQATFLAARSMIDLFRRTLDDAAPVTSISATTREGQAASVNGGWNTSPVTVTVTGATDTGRLGRASGVEAVLARWNGEDRGQGGTFDLFDGRHVVQGLSYDRFGNVDRTDFAVDIDTIPPSVSFPALKPVYLTSEWFVPDWVATDALSGVASTWAFLDDSPVVQGQPIDLALLAGFHVLTVYAKDVAGNVGWTEYQLEVLIDANAWPKPDRWNVNTQGAHACVVEFPFPYDVGLVDLATVTLAPGAIVTPLHALALAPVVDDDHDGLGDRAVRFDAGAFGAPLAGFEGDVPSTLAGRLTGGELAPGFVATCTIPVFSPGP